jgi:hypothetical protein
VRLALRIPVELFPFLNLLLLIPAFAGWVGHAAVAANVGIFAGITSGTIVVIVEVFAMESART